jgi:chromosome segregation ATPase
LREQLQLRAADRELDHKSETAAVSDDQNHENSPETKATATQITAKGPVDKTMLTPVVSAPLLTKSTQTVPIELHQPSQAQGDAAAVEHATTALRAKLSEMQSKHARIVAAHCARTDEAEGRMKKERQTAAMALADAQEANAALHAEINELKSKHARIVAAHSAATAEAHRLSHRLLTHVELDAYSHTQTTSSGVCKSGSPNGAITGSHEQSDSRREAVETVSYAIDSMETGLQHGVAGGTRHRTPPRR